MRLVTHERLTRTVATVAGLIGVTVLGFACQPAPVETPRRQLRIAAGISTGGKHQLGRALAEIFNAQIPNIDAAPLTTGGSADNLLAIEDGTAELGFTQADLAYFVSNPDSSSGAAPYRRLRAMAVLYLNAVHVIVPRDSDIRTVDDLAGRRIGIGETATPAILRAYGLEAQFAQEALDYRQITQRLERGEVEAGVIVSSFPVVEIQRLSTVMPLRFIGADPTFAHRVRSNYPFFRPIRIPRNTYHSQTDDIATVGVDNLLICRDDLDEDLVHQLTRILSESIGLLSEVNPAAAGIQTEQLPAAPIPLHSGAARFYREREIFR